jgi:hypothetical protein
VARSRAVVRSINFRIIPPTGTILMFEGQRFVMIGSTLHERSDGVTVPLIVWRSHCPNCDQPFECKTTLQARWPTRRCKRHRRPGQAVTTTGRERQKKHLSIHGRQRRAD